MRRVRVKPRNEKRAQAERERQFGELAEYVRSLPCAVKGCRGFAEPAHVHTRRNAGAWRELPTGERVGNIVPLCSWHHREQHRIGVRSFEAAHGVDLEAVARRVGEQHLDLGDTSPLPY